MEREPDKTSTRHVCLPFCCPAACEVLFSRDRKIKNRGRGGLNGREQAQWEFERWIGLVCFPSPSSSRFHCGRLCPPALPSHLRATVFDYRCCQMLLPDHVSHSQNTRWEISFFPDAFPRTKHQQYPPTRGELSTFPLTKKKDALLLRDRTTLAALRKLSDQAKEKRMLAFDQNVKRSV